VPLSLPHAEVANPTMQLNRRIRFEAWRKMVEDIAI